MSDVQKNTNSVVSWIALLFGALALPISIVAYNRSGEDLTETVDKQTSSVVSEAKDVTEQAAADMQAAKNNIEESAQQMQMRTELQTRLAKIQDEVKANKVTDATVKEIEDLRTDLKNTYADTTGDLKERSNQIDEDLSNLETQVRQDTASALDNIENLLERLKSSVLENDNE